MQRDRHEGYWGIVRDCLVRFHGLPPDVARDLALNESEAVATHGSEMYFHAEPFDSANDLARKLIEMSDEIAVEYDQIVARHYRGREALTRAG